MKEGVQINFQEIQKALKDINKSINKSRFKNYFKKLQKNLPGLEDRFNDLDSITDNNDFIKYSQELIAEVNQSLQQLEELLKDLKTIQKKTKIDSLKSNIYQLIIQITPVKLQLQEMQQQIAKRLQQARQEQLKQSEDAHAKMVAAAKQMDDYKKNCQNFSAGTSDTSKTVFKKLKTNREHNIQEGNKKPKTSSQQAKPPTITIVGLGPAGLTAAIEGYRAGAKVQVVEKRSEYSRNQTFRLPPNVMERTLALFLGQSSRETEFLSTTRYQDIVDKFEYLIHKLPEDSPMRFLYDNDRLQINKARRGTTDVFFSISTKDFEYLLNSCVELIAKNDPENMQIYRGYQFEESADNKIVISKDGKREIFETDLIVAADGSKSAVRQHYDAENYSKRSTEDYYVATSFFVTDTYAAKRKDNPDPRFNPNFDLNRLSITVNGETYKWESDSPPIGRFFDTGNQRYIGTELPESLKTKIKQLDEKIDKSKKNKSSDLYELTQLKDTLLIEWSKIVMSAYITDTADFDQMVAKKPSSFPVQLHAADKPVFMHNEADPKPPMVLVGDALHSAHFQTGLGAVMGINDANRIASDIADVVKQKTTMTESLTYYGRNALSNTARLHLLAFEEIEDEDLKVKPHKNYQNVTKLHKDYRKTEDIVKEKAPKILKRIRRKAEKNAPEILNKLEARLQELQNRFQITEEYSTSMPNLVADANTFMDELNKLKDEYYPKKVRQESPRTKTKASTVSGSEKNTFNATLDTLGSRILDQGGRGALSRAQENLLQIKNAINKNRENILPQNLIALEVIVASADKLIQQLEDIQTFIVDTKATLDNITRDDMEEAQQRFEQEDAKVVDIITNIRNQYQQAVNLLGSFMDAPEYDSPYSPKEKQETYNLIETMLQKAEEYKITGHKIAINLLKQYQQDFKNAPENMPNFVCYEIISKSDFQALIEEIRHQDSKRLSEDIKKFLSSCSKEFKAIKGISDFLSELKNFSNMSNPNPENYHRAKTILGELSKKQVENKKYIIEETPDTSAKTTTSDTKVERDKQAPKQQTKTAAKTPRPLILLKHNKTPFHENAKQKKGTSQKISAHKNPSSKENIHQENVEPAKGTSQKNSAPINPPSKESPEAKKRSFTLLKDLENVKKGKEALKDQENVQQKKEASKRGSGPKTRTPRKKT